MRLGALTSSIFVLAACSDHQGVAVEVIPGDSTITKVELFIGVEPCFESDGVTPCGITPQNESQRLHVGSGGGTWYRNDDGLFTADVHGGKANFQLEPTADGQTVQVVAVGIGPNGPVSAGVIRDLAVPMTGGFIAQMPLFPVQPVVANEPDVSTMHPDGDFVAVWNQSSAPSDCVLAEHWSGGVADRTFIVPVEDADCDGILTKDPADPTGMRHNPLECDSRWFDKTSSASTSDNADCATTAPLAGHTACLLAGPPCVDGQGAVPGSACKPVGNTTCLPSGMCTSRCAAAIGTGTATLSECIAPTNQPPVAFLQCTILVGDAMLPCGPTQASPPNSGTVDLSVLLASTTHLCTEIAFSATDSLANLDPQMNKLLVPAPSDAELDVSGLTAMPGKCSFTLTWNSGHIPYAATAFTTQPAVIEVGLDNGNNMVLPVKLDYYGCPTNQSTAPGITCYVVGLNGGGDSISSCAL